MTTSIGQLEGFARLILNARKDDDPSRRSDANPQSLDHAVGELIEALRSGVFTSSEAAMSSSCDSNETTAEVLSEALQLAMQDDALISRYELTDALAHALRLAKISPSTRAELQTPSFAPFASLLVHATDRCRLATLGTHADRLVRDISKLLLQLAACAAQIGQLRSGVEMISAIDGWTRDAAESVAKLCGALCNIAAGSTSDPSRASRLGQAAEDEGSSTSCATRATAPPPCLLSPETVVLTATALPPFYTAGYTRLSRSRGSFTNRLHAHESDTGAKGVTGPLSSFIPPPGDLSASSRRKRRQGENTRGASPDAGRTARAPQVEEMRRQVLRLVRELAHHHSRALTGAWHLFLPESTSAAFIAGASSSSSWRSPTMSSPSSLLDLVAGELDLAPRPSLRLRLEACHALRSLISPAARGFLSLAQEERHSSLQRFPQRQQPRQRAFTSLSARVGSLLRATHVQLSRMLRTERARMGTDLRLLGELLQMAKQLAELTPWRRMGADLSAELLGALSVLITGSGSKDTPSQSQPPCDELVHACAALPCLEATLLAVTPAGTPTRETNAPRVDSRQAEGLVTKMCALLRQFTETNSGKAMQTRSRCWRVLALLMSICDRTHVTAEALPLVERRRQVDDDEHTSVLRFLAAARRRGVQVHISTIVDLAQDSLCRVSRRADCKRAACDALSTLDLHALQEEDQEPSRSALELLLRTLGNAHEDLQVRAAACQAVGTLVREQTLVMVRSASSAARDRPLTPPRSPGACAHCGCSAAALHCSGRHCSHLQRLVGFRQCMRGVRPGAERLSRLGEMASSGDGPGKRAQQYQSASQWRASTGCTPSDQRVPFRGHMLRCRGWRRRAVLSAGEWPRARRQGGLECGCGDGERFHFASTVR